MSTTELLHFHTVILNSQDLYIIHRSECGNWLDEDRSSFLYSKMHKSGIPILTVQGALFCGKYQDPPKDLWKKRSTTSVGSWRFKKYTSCLILFFQTANIYPSWQWWQWRILRYINTILADWVESGWWPLIASTHYRRQTAMSHFIFNFEEQRKSEGYAKNYRFTVLYSRTPKILWMNGRNVQIGSLSNCAGTENTHTHNI